jgi:asparagine synthase (glutamine-hydrolysing)
MCGIGAIFHYNSPERLAPPGEWLAAVNRAQRRRGPDGEGVWVAGDGLVGLGHRRLAIIDLTDAGAQPMVSIDGKARIVFNGEIYNYRELRAELEGQGCRFQSGSDTEVILELYQRCGKDCVHKLRGMYAFAIWDEGRQGLFLARDPFGIKPLYYADNGKTFMAASQVKALLAAGGVDTRPEPAGHVGFFLWGYVPEPYTCYRGIRALPAGSTLWVEKGSAGARMNRFCDVAREIAAPAGKVNSRKRPSIRYILEKALADSVAHHMVADVPVGVFLSAGLDSTSIAAIAARCTKEPLRTLTLGFEEYKGTLHDETPLAEMVASRLGCAHITRWVRARDFRDDLQRLLEAMDQPTIDGANTYFVSKAAAEAGLKVALSGLGGDELFGGYPSFHHIPWIMKVAAPFSWFGRFFRVVTEPVIRRFTSPKYAGIFEHGRTLGGAYLLRWGLFMPWELPRILDPDMVREGWRELSPVAQINQTLPPGRVSGFAAVSALETTWYMRNMLLRDSDWAGMAHSLEIRVPLVDLELVRALAPLSASRQRPSKQLMVQCAWEGAPPQEIVNRPKTGFSIPVREWIAPESQEGERGLRGWARLVHSVASNWTL